MIRKLAALRHHAGFMKYFKNTSWLFAEKILRMAVGLFVGVWVARYLGPEQYGLLSYAGSFVTLFTIIATLGLDGIVPRELVKDEADRDRLLGTAFGLKLGGAILALGVLGIAVQFTSNDSYTNVLVFIIASATVFQSFNVIDFYFQSRVLSKYIVFANVAGLFLSTLVKIALILYEAPLTAFAAVVVFDSAVLAMGYIYFYRHCRLTLKQWRFDGRLARSLLHDSWPLILSGAVLMVQARIDQVMLQEMVGSEEVGYYSVAMKLIEAFGFIPMLLKKSLFPAIINAKDHSESLYAKRLTEYYRLNFALFVVTALPIFFFSESIVTFLYGEAYQPAGVLLSLFAVRLFFANMGVARGVYVLTENLYRFSLLTMVVGTVTNIGLNYFWIPTYASIGALYATIVSFFVTIFLLDIFYTKTRTNVFRMFKSIFTFYKMKGLV